ncbi:MAG: tetratricopeptide repeat protein [Planctomycetes bacterium]|nr:tetratricopeptide repeat protein [Planctomycetota bacterium]
MSRIGAVLACLVLVAGCQSSPPGGDLPANIRGDQAYEQGDYESAAELYTFWLADHPGDFMSLYRRGICWDKLGDPSAALTSLTAALESRPDNRDALMARAHVYYELNNPKLAMTDLERAIGLDGFEEVEPHVKVMAYALLAQIAFQGGEHDVALKALDKGVYLAEEFEGHVSPHHLRRLLYNRAMTEFELGYYGPARDDFERYLVLTQDEGADVSESDWYNACFLNYMAEDFEKARTYFANLTDAQMEVLAEKTKDPTFFVAAVDVPRDRP